MSANDVMVVRTGTANLASVCTGLQRIGARPQLTNDPAAIENAHVAVLPGVGAFGAAMKPLRDAGLDNVLAERIRAGRPTLAVCVGLQLLCESSTESPGVSGLGVIPGRIERFPNSLRVPQLGWNRVVANGGSLVESGYAYFANSYRLPTTPPGWTAAHADYGGRFVAALEWGNVLACQFHPELSGVWGVALLRRWLTRATEGAVAC